MLYWMGNQTYLEIFAKNTDSKPRRIYVIDLLDRIIVSRLIPAIKNGHIKRYRLSPYTFEPGHRFRLESTTNDGELQLISARYIEEESSRPWKRITGKSVRKAEKSD